MMTTAKVFDIPPNSNPDPLMRRSPVLPYDDEQSPTQQPSEGLKGKAAELHVYIERFLKGEITAEQLEVIKKTLLD